ncbi:endolytic transglycosylase MltG [Candidatus Competibacter phosphatis]|uniref:Endolytic murein transglycosylase n=1 Tax=Candidatus Competibacter phosphatis TaxID=221280 RepID=A0ABX1TJK7_9GAMM|nr:endolytic transglycosylase MltG [Candidatus Competibacter phosphatis]
MRFSVRLRLSLSIALAVLVAGAALYGIHADYRRFLDTPLGVPTDGLVLEVKPGMGIGAIARELRRQPGLLRSTFYLEAYARFNGLAPRLKVGEYALAPGMTPRDLLERIATGQVIQYPLTVVEGWTFQQLRQALAAHPKIAQTLREASDAEIMARLDRPGRHPEGWFFPDTYHFPAGFTDEAFLRRALTAMEQRLARAWSQRAADLPLDDPYQALILASIVEKETGLTAERPAIAGVFARRLRAGMLLQTDPTVIYGLGAAFDGDLRRRDLVTDTPYNTYTRKGLPPTPIALPGAGALEAAVHPAAGDALYFVADGQGGHVFSRTLDEHNRAVRRYQLREK